MLLPALSRVARSVLSRRIYGQAPAAMSRWMLAGARAPACAPPLHRNLSDATGTGRRRFSFFFSRHHKLNAAIVVSAFSVAGGQIWHMSNRNLHAAESKEVGREESIIRALACLPRAERPNTQNGGGEEDTTIIAQFKDWMDEYGIQYPDEETRQNRLSIFKANVELHGYHTYKQYRSALDALCYSDLVESVVRRPKVDWVEAGVVSPIVREQRHCGCCWAMAVVASVDALHYMKTKQSIMLSVQELIDCVTENEGCTGGYSEPALGYIQKNGLSSESSYGYTDKSHGLCQRGNKALVATISGFNTVSTTEEALEEAVAKQPVIILLQWPPSMDSYKGGIIESEYLPPTLPDGTSLPWHYVLIVGYDTDSTGVNYWRFKNSWGENWGEGGYGRIRRHIADERGVLGMLTYPAVYPVP